MNDLGERCRTGNMCVRTCVATTPIEPFRKTVFVTPRVFPETESTACSSLSIASCSALGSSAT